MDITKMHGLGNDFILVNAGDVKENEFSALAAKLCRRRLSVGADGLIAVCPSDIADAKMRIFIDFFDQSSSFFFTAVSRNQSCRQ